MPDNGNLPDRNYCWRRDAISGDNKRRRAWVRSGSQVKRTRLTRNTWVRTSPEGTATSKAEKNSNAEPAPPGLGKVSAASQCRRVSGSPCFSFGKKSGIRELYFKSGPKSLQRVALTQTVSTSEHRAESVDVPKMQKHRWNKLVLRDKSGITDKATGAQEQAPAGRTRALASSPGLPKAPPAKASAASGLLWRSPPARGGRRQQRGPSHGAGRGRRKRQAPTACRKLVRFGAHLYKVEGKGHGRTLTRQTSSAIKRTAAASLARRIASEASAKVTARVLSRQLGACQRAPSRWARARTPRGAAPPSLARALAARRVRQSLEAARRVSLAAKRANLQRRDCPVFCRTGVCRRAQAGACKMLHDPGKVAVCAKWLHGDCCDPNCKKQHRAKPELMPICLYFLQGLCSNAECPYLHVNHDPAAPVCQAFTQGYCPKGRGCPMKHFTKQQVAQLRRQREEDGNAEGGAEVTPYGTLPPLFPLSLSSPPDSRGGRQIYTSV